MRIVCWLNCYVGEVNIYAKSVCKEEAKLLIWVCFKRQNFVVFQVYFFIFYITQFGKMSKASTNAFSFLHFAPGGVWQ